MKKAALIFFCLLSVISTYAQFNDPYRISYDGENYYISNKGDGTITKTRNGIPSTIITGLHSPNDLFFGAIAGNSVILLLDSNLVKIYDSTSNGLLLTLPITGAQEAHDGIFNPNNTNEFFISDRTGNKIIKGVIGPAPFYPVTFTILATNIIKPTGMIFNSLGKLVVVSDTVNANIYEINIATGTSSIALSTSIDSINDIAQDDEGNYYITNWGDDILYRFSNTWTNQVAIDTFNQPSGLLKHPHPLIDILLICDTKSQSIEVRNFHSISPKTDMNTCGQDSFIVEFFPNSNEIGTYNPGNIFNIEMSDSNGNFTFPIIIGSALSDTPQISIKAAVPSGDYAVSGHKYRISSTSPLVGGWPSRALTINPNPDASLVQGNVIYGCQGSIVKFDHPSFNGSIVTSISYTGSFDEFIGKEGNTYSFLSSVDSIYSYRHTASNISTGCEASFPFTIDISSSLQISLADTLSMCQGDTIALSSSTQTYKYVWSGSTALSDNTSPQPVFYGTSSTQVNVTLSDSNNVCTGQDSIYVSVNPKPELSFTLQEFEFCIGDTIFRDFTAGDSLNFTYINYDQTPLASSGWIADSIGRFGYELVYSYISTGCSDIFGNGYGVNHKDDSVRIVTLPDNSFLTAQVFGGQASTSINWYVNGTILSVPFQDTIHTSRLRDGDSIYAASNRFTQCPSFSNTITWEVLSVDQPFSQFSIYPNPSSGIFTLETKAKVKEIAIVDLRGKEMYRGNASRVNTDLANGLYYITVKTTEGTGTKKLLINR
jgi:hypothetical protein